MKSAEERFESLELIGTGAMCRVVRARDRTHGEIVALKTLQAVEPNTLYRLKQEFRALSRLDHPNLVQYLEMGTTADGLYIAMEYVEGTDFLTWVRGDEEPRQFRSETIGKTAAARFARADEDGASPPWPERPLPKARLPDLFRLRSALGQLAEGLHALHQGKRLHRDLKPANVFVTPAGRVVVLDFGLVAELDQEYTEGTLIDGLAGSAAYMSPEQAVGDALTTASDWYSVGVVLYEALTGVWPFHGTLYPILMGKQRFRPTPPGVLVPGVPDDLDALCMHLLERRPEDRPRGEDVVAVLRARRAEASAGWAPPAEAPLRFRDSLLAASARAIAASRREQTQVVLIRGPVGSGRTRLLREVVKRARRQVGTRVLKARGAGVDLFAHHVVDDLLDNATRVLRREGTSLSAPLHTRSVRALANLFPALARVEDLELQAHLRAPSAEDIARAPDGLRAIFQVLSQDHPLLLAIDDADRGDIASAELLGRALRAEPERPMTVLLLAAERSLFTDAVMDRAAAGGCVVDAFDLPTFEPDQAEAFVRLVLGDELDEAAMGSILAAGAGLPKQLLAAVERVGPRAALAPDEVVAHAVGELPPRWRGLLEQVALADGGASLEVVVAAGRLGPDTFHALTALRAHRLLVDADPAGERLCVNGEALSRWLVAQIPTGARTQRLAGLAAAFDATGRADPGLVSLWQEAGDPDRAGVVAWRVAEAAIAARDDAAALPMLDCALRCTTWAPRDRRTIAIAAAGAQLRELRVDAAVASLDLALAGGPTEARRQPYVLRRAEALLLAGGLEPGLQALEALHRQLGGEGLAPPTVGLVARLLGREPEAPPFVAKAVVAPEAALRADASHAAYAATAWLDRRRAAVGRARHIRDLIDAGDRELQQRLALLDAVRAAERGDDPAPALARATQAGATGPSATARAEATRARLALFAGAFDDAEARSAAAWRVQAVADSWSGIEILELRATFAHATAWAGRPNDAPSAWTAPIGADDARNPSLAAVAWGTVGHLSALARGAPAVEAAEALAQRVVGIPRAWAVLGWARHLRAVGRLGEAIQLLDSEWDSAEACGALDDPLLAAGLWAAGVTPSRGATGRWAARNAMGRSPLPWVRAWAAALSAGSTAQAPPLIQTAAPGSPLAVAVWG